MFSRRNLESIRGDRDRDMGHSRRQTLYIYLFVGSVRKKEGNCVDLEEELLEAVIACMKQMYLFCHRCAIIVGNPTFSLSNVILRHLGYIYIDI